MKSLTNQRFRFTWAERRGQGRLKIWYNSLPLMFSYRRRFWLIGRVILWETRMELGCTEIVYMTPALLQARFNGRILELQEAAAN